MFLKGLLGTIASVWLHLDKAGSFGLHYKCPSPSLPTKYIYLSAPMRPIKTQAFWTLHTLLAGEDLLKNSSTLALYKDFPTTKCTGLLPSAFLMSRVLNTTDQSSMQHCNSQPAEEPARVEEFTYQKEVQVGKTLGNAVGEVEKSMKAWKPYLNL